MSDLGQDKTDLAKTFLPTGRLGLFRSPNVDSFSELSERYDQGEATGWVRLVDRTGEINSADSKPI